LRIAQKTKQKKYQLCCLKDINNVKSKNILKIRKNKREVKYIKETFEVLFDTVINSLLFTFLFFNILSTFISNFVANKIVATC